MSNTATRTRRYKATFLVTVNAQYGRDDAADVAYLASTAIHGDVTHRGDLLPGAALVQVELSFLASSDDDALTAAQTAMRSLHWPADSLAVATGRGRNRRVVR